TKGPMSGGSSPRAPQRRRGGGGGGGPPGGRGGCGRVFFSSWPGSPSPLVSLARARRFPLFFFPPPSSYPFTTHLHPTTLSLALGLQMQMMREGRVDRALGDRVALQMSVFGVAPSSLGALEPAGAAGKFIDLLFPSPFKIAGEKRHQQIPLRAVMHDRLQLGI